MSEVFIHNDEAIPDFDELDSENDDSPEAQLVDEFEKDHLTPAEQEFIRKACRI